MTLRIYDMDGTLYSNSQEQWRSCNNTAVSILEDRFKVRHDPATIHKMIVAAIEAGKHWASPFVNGERSLADIHHAYHERKDLDGIIAHPDLAGCFEQLKDDQHIIVTHSSLPFAVRVIEQRLKLRHIFHDRAIVGFEHYWEMKSDGTLGLETALTRAGETPGSHVKFYEDSVRNLIPAKRRLGLTTIFIGEASGVPPEFIHDIDDIVPDICASLQEDLPQRAP